MGTFKAFRRLKRSGLCHRSVPIRHLSADSQRWNVSAMLWSVGLWRAAAAGAQPADLGNAGLKWKPTTIVQAY